MEAMRKVLDQALRGGEHPRAMAAARKWGAETDKPPKETAIEIAKVVGAVYRDLLTEPAVAFVEQVPSAVPPEIATIIQKALDRLFRLSSEWADRVAACREERMAREMRDLVREKNFEGALQRVATLSQTAVPRTAHNYDEEIRQRVLYIGNVLGTCLNHPKETDQLIELLWRNPESFGLSQELLHEMKSAKDQRHAQMMAARFDNLEAQWTAQLKAAQVDILHSMPGKNEMGDPEPEQLRDVGDIFRSVARAPVDRQQPDMFIETTLLLVDFVPKETGVAALSSGIEGRSYGNLGFRARKAVGMVYMDIGKLAPFTKPYLEWSRGALGGRYDGQIVEVMGALRSDEFAPLLVELWKQNRTGALREELSTAVGNLASPEAADVLLADLADVFSNKASGMAEQLRRLNEFKTSQATLDAGAVRRASKLLSGLGRIVRSPRTDDTVRRRIIDTVVDIVPQDNRKLGQMVVMDILAGKPECLTAKERAWAVEKLIDALWVQDQSTDMHKGGEREATVIGAHRAEISRALVRIGKDRIDDVLVEFDKNAGRFSGALIAAAEILQEVKDPRAVPTLHRMLFQAAAYDDSKQNQYQKETYWDTTAQERRPLRKDMVTAAIVFALVTIGGEEAQMCLEEFRKRVQMGQIRDVGKETLELLARHVKEQPPEAAAPPTGPGVGVMPELVTIAGTGGARHAAIDPEEVKQLIKAISGSYLLTGAAKRAQAKIQALVRLAQLTPEEALAPVFDNIADKDPMVVSAAISTLTEYGAPGKPSMLMDMLLEHVEKALESKNDALRLAMPKLIKELGPNRPEIKKRLVPIIKVIKHADVRSLLTTLFQETRLKETPQGPGPVRSTGLPGEGGDQKAAAGEDAPPPPPTGMSLLEAKRLYMIERQRWIKGGKKGDPPPLPPGVKM